MWIVRSLALGVAAVMAVVGAQAAEPEDGRLTVTISKAHLLRLAKDASVVMVADPLIADVAIQSPRLVFVLGKLPGETSLFILDKKGRNILTSDVLVIPAADRQVTINRGVVEATYSCAPRCAEVMTPTAIAPGTPAAPPSSGSSATTTGSSATTTSSSAGGSTASSNQTAADIAASAAAAAAQALGLSSGQPSSAQPSSGQ